MCSFNKEKSERKGKLCTNIEVDFAHHKHVNTYVSS